MPLRRDHLRGGGRSQHGLDLPLYRLSDTDRLGVSREHPRFCRAFCAPRHTKTYVKTTESGNKRRHAFCGNCGTPIYACAIDNPRVYGLRVGTISQRAALKPQRQGWRRSALGWIDGLAAVAATEKGWS